MVGMTRRLGRTLRSKLRSPRTKRGDPKVELERIVAEVHAHHGPLVEQASAALTAQREVEQQLSTTVTKLERTKRHTTEARLWAEEATRAGKPTEVAEHTAAATSFANQLTALVREVERLDHLALQRAIASDAAKAGVRASAEALEQRLTERHEALAPPDRAALRAQLDEAKALLAAPVGADAPTVEEVEARIAARPQDDQATNE